MIFKEQIIYFFEGALLRSHFYSVNKNSQKVIMTGSPRSGTTFLAELTSDYLNNAPIIWEPLMNEQINRYKLNCGIRPINADLEKNNKLKNYLSMLFIEPRLDYYNTRIRERSYREKLRKGSNHYLIYKFVRANGLAESFNGWIQNEDLVFGIVRNPYSVISSQLNHHEFKGHPAYSDFTQYINLVENAKKSVKESLERDLTITWCVDYLNITQSDVKIFYFENVVSTPSIVFHHLEENGFKGNKNNVSPNKKSTTFIGNENETDYLDKYKRYLSDGQISIIKDVIDIFSIKYPVGG